MSDTEQRIKDVVHELRALSDDLHFMKEVHTEDLDVLEDAVASIEMVVKLNLNPILKGETNE